MVPCRLAVSALHIKFKACRVVRLRQPNLTKHIYITRCSRLEGLSMIPPSPDGLHSSTLDVFRSNKVDVETCKAAPVSSQSRATDRSAPCGMVISSHLPAIHAAKNNDKISFNFVCLSSEGRLAS